MTKPLTPENLTFFSFMHSQGTMGLQLQVFRYMKLSFDLEPDLHPTAATFKRYMNFLIGAKSNSSKPHIYSDAQSQNNPGKMIINTFKSLRDFKYTHEGKAVARQSEQATLINLTYMILQREIDILGGDIPWGSEVKFEATDRAERLRARILEGKTSFLYFYGRDGRSTGTTEFNQLYSDVWSTVPNIEAKINVEYAGLVDRHAQCIADAEYNVMSEVSPKE